MHRATYHRLATPAVGAFFTRITGGVHVPVCAENVRASTLNTARLKRCTFTLSPFTSTAGTSASRAYPAASWMDCQSAS